MTFPRIFAMSEVLWKGPTNDLEKDYINFLSRVEPHLQRLDTKQINYGNHLYDLEGGVIKNQGASILCTYHTNQSQRN